MSACPPERSSFSRDRRWAEPSPAPIRCCACRRLRVQHALSVLKAKGLIGASGSTKVSARLDTDLLAAARARIGAKTDTELLTAALVMAAGADDFGAWLVTRGTRLPADFELEF